MDIFVCGINHKTADIKIRELLSFNEKDLPEALIKLKKLPFVDECVLLSTCNRTEVYVYSQTGFFDQEVIEEELCRFKNLDIYNLRKYFYCYFQLNAVKHLFKVASGLDSLVIGEDQIIGQVKDAFEKALSLKSSKVILNKLFMDAIYTAKKVKTETDVSKKPVSIGSIAVKLLKDIFKENFENKIAFVIGSGNMGKILINNLISNNIKKIYNTSRSFNGRNKKNNVINYINTVEYSKRYEFIDLSDIIISSTSSPHYTITRDLLEKVINVSKERVFLDLAVPRDIDPSISYLPNVRYFNIDDLRSVAEENNYKRLSEVSRAEQIVEEMVFEFEKWYKFRQILPLVKEIEENAFGYVNRNINVLLSRLNESSTNDKETIKRYVYNTSRHIIKKFIYSFKDCQYFGDTKVFLKYLAESLKK